MNNNKIYNKDMKGNVLFNELLKGKGSDKKAAEVMGITDDEFNAVKILTNLKAKLGMESISSNIHNKSLKIMEFWNDFKHQVHHEKELATVLNHTPKKQKN